MPSSDDTSDVRLARRSVLGSSVGLLAGLCGCSATGGDGDDGSPATGNDVSGGSNRTDAATRNGGSDTDEPAPLRIGGSGAGFRTLQDAGALWNENPEPDEYGDWAPERYGIDTEARLANHFASEHGFATTGERAEPPFVVAISSASTAEAGSDLERGDVDLAFTGGTPVERHASDRLDTESLVEHSIGRTGNVFLVSAAIAEADVALRPAEIKSIYANEITNWSEVGGPDREIAVVTGAAGTPPRPIEQGFFRGVEIEGLEARFGKPQNRYEYLDQRDDAIADLPVRESYSDDGPRPVPAVVDGERRTFRDPGYPAMHPVRIYSSETSGDRARAFLDYLQSSFVQQRFVEERRRLLPLEPDE